MERIVWLQSPPWDSLWTRQNHFARRFAAAGAEILYVENPPSFRARLGKRRESLRQVEPRLDVMSLPLQVPGSRSNRLAGKINGRRFAAAVERELSRRGWDRPLYWCRLPIAVETLRHLRPGRVVYDVTDDYAFYSRSDREARLTQARETTLARRADQIFTTTPALAERLGKLNARTAVIPNGVDQSFFTREAFPDPMPHVPRPRIGYIGLVADWMDFDLLQRLGEKWPGQVVIVGPVKDEARTRFARIPGLVRIPQIPNLDVPRYLQHFDVCILPHKAIELRHRSDPLKVMEYLSSGRPVVSTALRNVQALGGVVDTADDHDQFIAAVAHHLRKSGAAEADARKDFAKSRDWDHLFAKVVAILTGEEGTRMRAVQP